MQHSSLKDLVKAVYFDQGSKAVEAFMERHLRYMLRCLRDVLLQIDRTIRLLESFKDASLSTLEHFGKLKVDQSQQEDLLVLTADFPSFLDNLEVEQERLPSARFEESKQVETLLEGCKTVSTRLRFSIASTIL